MRGCVGLHHGTEDDGKSLELGCILSFKLKSLANWEEEDVKHKLTKDDVQSLSSLVSHATTHLHISDTPRNLIYSSF